MSKTIKLIAILLMAVLLIGAFSQVVYAVDDDEEKETKVGTDYSKIISEVDSSGNGESGDVSGIKQIAGRVVRAIRTIAAIAAVVIISILGIKYMIGSTEERADYKKSFIPLIIGIVVVLAAAQIATMIFSVSGN